MKIRDKFAILLFGIVIIRRKPIEKSDIILAKDIAKAANIAPQSPEHDAIAGSLQKLLEDSRSGFQYGDVLDAVQKATDAESAQKYIDRFILATNRDLPRIDAELDNFSDEIDDFIKASDNPILDLSKKTSQIQHEITSGLKSKMEKREEKLSYWKEPLDSLLDHAKQLNDLRRADYLFKGKILEIAKILTNEINERDGHKTALLEAKLGLCKKTLKENKLIRHETTHILEGKLSRAEANNEGAFPVKPRKGEFFALKKEDKIDIIAKVIDRVAVDELNDFKDNNSLGNRILAIGKILDKLLKIVKNPDDSQNYKDMQKITTSRKPSYAIKNLLKIAIENKLVSLIDKDVSKGMQR